MPSSLTLPAADHPTRREQLLDALERVPDPRDPRGKRYPPPSVLALAITATIAGARSFAAIGQWAADAPGQRLGAFGILGQAPEASTLRKLFTRLDADALVQALGVWMWTRTQVVGG